MYVNVCQALTSGSRNIGIASMMDLMCGLHRCEPLEAKLLKGGRLYPHMDSYPEERARGILVAQHCQFLLLNISYKHTVHTYILTMQS
jgi:hypothetical protein